MGSKVIAQLAGISGLKCDMRKTVLRFALQVWKDFNVLVIIDLEIRKH